VNTRLSPHGRAGGTCWWCPVPIAARMVGCAWFDHRLQCDQGVPAPDWPEPIGIPIPAAVVQDRVCGQRNRYRFWNRRFFSENEMRGIRSPARSPWTKDDIILTFL
jgi:hypothetical protein